MHASEFGVPVHRGCTAGLTTWSTRSVGRAQRLDLWNSVTSSAFTGLTIDASEPDRFEADLASIDLGAVGIARVDTDGSVVRHTAAHAAADKAEPYFLVHLQIAGTSVNHQAGRSAALGPGDFTLVDSARPYWLEFGADTRFIVCRARSAYLRMLLRRVDDIVAHRVPRTAGAVRVFRSLLETLWTELAGDDPAGFGAEAGSLVLEALAFACDSARGRDRRCDPALAMFERIKQVIGRRLRDPGLSAATIADELNVTPRHVQKLCAEHGTTPRALILRQRIREAPAFLLARDASVTTAAMDLGFNDLTHFGRVFRKTYGVAPREYRRQRAAKP